MHKSEKRLLGLERLPSQRAIEPTSRTIAHGLHCASELVRTALRLARSHCRKARSSTSASFAARLTAPTGPFPGVAGHAEHEDGVHRAGHQRRQDLALGYRVQAG